MDKYVIDLDKVLDELELNDNYDGNESNNRQSNVQYDSTNNLIIDLNDADFSIHSKPPKFLISNSSPSPPLSNSNDVLVEPNNNIEILNKSNQKPEYDSCLTDHKNDDDDKVINDDLSVIEHTNVDSKKSTQSEIIHQIDQISNDDNDNEEQQNVDENDNSESKHSNCLINEKQTCDNECNLVSNENISDQVVLDDQKTNVINLVDESTTNELQITSEENVDKPIDHCEKNKNDLDENTIGAMSEEDLDRYLGDLNDDLEEFENNTSIQNDSQPAQQSEPPDRSINENKDEQLVQQEIKQNDSILIENGDNQAAIKTSKNNNSESEITIKSELIANNNDDEDNVDENEYWSRKLGLNDNDKNEQNRAIDDDDGEEEQAQQLQELEEILANSNEQQQPKPVSQTNSENNNQSDETNRTNETRGGLVQNINYFERQEMPNGLTEEEQMLGKVRPFWIPDEDAQNCLHCDVRFTLIKRRHHCRSCGKVLCSQCCNFKAQLPYLEYKEARVCQLCYAILMKIEEIERINVNNSQSDHPPDPNNPSEYCSTISPLEQVSEAINLPLPTVMVPVGVLKRTNGNNRRSNNSSSDSSNNEITTVKQVIFSDGVRPGGDLVEQPTSSSSTSNNTNNSNCNMDANHKPVITRTQLQVKSPLAEKILVPFENFSKRFKFSRIVVSDSINGQTLPPIINYNELKSINSSLPSKPNYGQLLEILRDPQLPWITFGLTKNLHINTKIISKTCCNSQECWSFSSKGLASVGQDEIVCVIDCQSLRRCSTTVSNDERSQTSSSSSSSCSQNSSSSKMLLEFPRDVLRMYTTLYDSASTANLYMDLMHIFFPDGLFNNKENSGFIFTRPTMQCLRNIHLPPPPFLIAILIHRWEIPWAKIFPLRLVLRLGYEYKMYPSPVISYANRKSAYFEIGHTIMNVLADFRNFHYTLSVVKDLFICVEQRKRVTLFVPKLSYEKVCKVLSTSNEHVLAFGGNLSLRADSHLVCVQNEDDDDIHSQYRTEISSYPGSSEKLTGASFIVFSGVLKSSTGLKAKMNIVEDGLLVQIPPSLMEEFRSAIKDMKDFRIDCCKVNDTNSNPDEWIQLKWVNDELSTNLGVRSQIDGLNLEGIQSARIFSNPDYANERYLIRWTEVFLLQINDNGRRSEVINANKLAESVAQAFCVALIDYLDQLYENGLTKISLRISLDIDKVGYESGSGGKPLPPQITQPLDDALIPVIMSNISTTGIEDPLVIELLFFVLLK
ncbi:Zinc finger FYVE domain-containing protein 9 [Dermatophagoides pteronyssinus]|uniref:Zinc finger FYVE domain-containing protein 9 n=1 Tax=Dermatophagoides pteronyssinus TaxID=6956 RepID=A0ABQ8JD85_DERPT|nr:Zinc finger FYVE domain-containing protein 9 [Dermatophagoides pteronyssinus]